MQKTEVFRQEGPLIFGIFDKTSKTLFVFEKDTSPTLKISIGTLKDVMKEELYLGHLYYNV